MIRNMVTPEFTISQDNNHVYINVQAPYCNISRSEVHADRYVFLFMIYPYHLRLRLPGRIYKIDGMNGSFTCETGEFNLKFGKEIPGEYFPNLKKIKNSIQPHCDGANTHRDKELDEILMSFEETPPKTYAFGFAGKIKKDFRYIGDEFPLVFELLEPERFSSCKRHKIRTKYENRKFSILKHVFDSVDADLLQPILNAVAPWNEPDFDANCDFTEDEKSILWELPKSHYILNKQERQEVFLTLVDILYACCYARRTTTINEDEKDSSFPINKLSSTFTCFCTFKNMREVLKACYRRVQSFGVHTNFELCNKVKEDVATLLGKGKKPVIKFLIQAYEIINSGADGRYILNQLYVGDYLIYLQKCKEEHFQKLAKSVFETEVQKWDLDMNLYLTEYIAKMYQRTKTQGRMTELTLSLNDNKLIPRVSSRLRQAHDEEEEDVENNLATAASSEAAHNDTSDESPSSNPRQKHTRGPHSPDEPVMTGFSQWSMKNGTCLGVKMEITEVIIVGKV
ncbi:protein SHQ1 homolog [Epargyreus clarus]|uniref:protein SHQ1 homolog n=1 Tax=Epargyreus clarus TaxID=520877 RepID=UPI003C2E5C4F